MDDNLDYLIDRFEFVCFSSNINIIMFLIQPCEFLIVFNGCTELVNL